MTIAKRLEGVFFSPRPVFDSLAEKPAWIDMFILILVALIAFNLVVAPYMQRDQLQMLKDNAALKARIGDDAYARMVDRTEHPSQVTRIMQIFIATPLFFLAALLLQSLLLLILGRFVSTKGTFVQVLSALVHASLVDKLLGNAVRLVLALTRKSLMQTSTSLALLFPKLEVTSASYIMLTQVDFFQLWLFGILGLGLAAVFKISLKKALILSYALWFLKAVTNIGIGLIGASFLR